MKPVYLVARRLTTATGLFRYLFGALLWLPVMVIPLAGGLLLKQIFDQLSAGGALSVTWLCAVFVAVEVVRGVILVTAWTYGDYWWAGAATVLRANVLRSIFTARGPARVHTSGQVLARLRDDVSDPVQLVDELVELTGAVLFTGGAGTPRSRTAWPPTSWTPPPEPRSRSASVSSCCWRPGRCAEATSPSVISPCSPATWAG